MSKKQHILFLSSWYPSKVLVTNGDFIQRHAEAVSLEHKVSVLHMITDKNISKSKIEINTKNNVTSFIGYIKPTNNKILKKIRFFKIYKQMIRNIGNFDLIHLNVLYPFGILALYEKIRRKKAYIISEHWTGYHFPQSKSISFFEKIFSKIICKNASYICPVSNHLASSMQQLGLNGNYIRVPNVVDTDFFKPVSIKKKQFTIVHVSSFKNSHKNISGMIKAAKLLENEIPDFTWHFIGGNSNEYTDEIEKLNFKSKSVKFINHISHNKLITYLQKADVFVLFSNFENLPCVILESFSCGIPVISTKTGGISEFFPNDFGYFVEVNDVESLVKNLKKIYQKPIDKPQKMHKYAKENFSKQVIANQFSTIYKKALKNNS